MSDVKHLHSDGTLHVCDPCNLSNNTPLTVKPGEWAVTLVRDDDYGCNVLHADHVGSVDEEDVSCESRKMFDGIGVDSGQIAVSNGTETFAYTTDFGDGFHDYYIFRNAEGETHAVMVLMGSELGRLRRERIARMVSEGGVR